MVFAGIDSARRLVGMAVVAPSPQGGRALFVGVACEAGGEFVASAPAMAADGVGRCCIDSARCLFGAAAVHDVSEGIAIEMVVDRSGSMGQELNFEGRDRTRLEVVKEIFQRFVYGDGKSLEGRPNDLIGIISFARYAETACPLTLSQKVLKVLVEKIDLARDQSEDGTAIGEALALAIARLHTADETLAKQLKKQKMDYHIKSKVIILLTDGENNYGRKVESVIDLAVKCGVRVHVIGISGNGMMVVQTPFGKKKLPVRQPPLDTRELKALAEKTGGSFQMAATAERLLEIYADIDKMERTKIETIRFVDYKELFQPLALTALGLVVMKLLLEASLFRRLP